MVFDSISQRYPSLKPVALGASVLIALAVLVALLLHWTAPEPHTHTRTVVEQSLPEAETLRDSSTTTVGAVPEVQSVILRNWRIILPIVVVLLVAGLVVAITVPLLEIDKQQSLDLAQEQAAEAQREAERKRLEDLEKQKHIVDEDDKASDSSTGLSTTTALLIAAGVAFAVNLVLAIFSTIKYVDSFEPRPSPLSTAAFFIVCALLFQGIFVVAFCLTSLFMRLVTDAPAPPLIWPLVVVIRLIFIFLAFVLFVLSFPALYLNEEVKDCIRGFKRSFRRLFEVKHGFFAT